MASKTRWIENDKGTGLLIMVTYHKSEELEKVGFPNGVTVYSLFSISEWHSHYDEHKLLNSLNYNQEEKDWIIEELWNLESEL